MLDCLVQSRAMKTSQAAMPSTGRLVISMPKDACRQMPTRLSQCNIFISLACLGKPVIDHAIRQSPAADSMTQRLLRSPNSPLTATRMVDAALEVVSLLS